MTSDIKILIIDNIFYNRAQIKNILVPKKYLIEEATGIIEGIFKLQIHKPNIIIIGMNLIKSEGIKIIPMFFEQKNDVKIIAYNIFGEDIEFENQIRKNGILSIIYKPIEEKKLLSAINNALKLKISIHPIQENQNIEKINIQIIKSVVDTIVVILSNIMNCEILKGRLFFLPLAFTTMGIGSIIDFKGDFDGKIMIDMPITTAIFIASKVIKENIDQMNDLVRSSIVSW